jgi:hypothetical protein
LKLASSVAPEITNLFASFCAFYNSKRLWFLGFGLYWAWMHIAFFTPMLFPSFGSGIAITAQEI